MGQLGPTYPAHGNDKMKYINYEFEHVMIAASTCSVEKLKLLTCTNLTAQCRLDRDIINVLKQRCIKCGLLESTVSTWSMQFLVIVAMYMATGKQKVTQHLSHVSDS